MKNETAVKAREQSTALEFAIERIREAILDGSYSPGQRLIESDITATLGVSRGPVRDALRHLSREGLVEIIPYRGALVCRLSREEVLGLFKVREALEILAAGLAAENVDAGQNRAKAEAALAELNTTTNSGFNAGYMEENRKFHQLICDLSGNTHIARLLDQLQLPAIQPIFFELFDRDRQDHSRTEHHAILTAILNGDSGAAEASMKEHVRHSADLIQEVPNVAFRPK